MVEAQVTSAVGLALLGVSSVAGIGGASLFAIAIWRHGRLPKWTVVLYALSFPLLAFPVTFATELLGAALPFVGAGKMAWQVWQQSAAAKGQSL